MISIMHMPISIMKSCVIVCIRSVITSNAIYICIVTRRNKYMSTLPCFISYKANYFTTVCFPALASQHHCQLQYNGVISGIMLLESSKVSAVSWHHCHNSPIVCAVLALDSWNYCSGKQARQPNIHKIPQSSLYS